MLQVVNAIAVEAYECKLFLHRGKYGGEVKKVKPSA
ncbi:hypothetical protein PAP_05455 [Palaeococcus pacificus DY20341]|uniref:Uncharacterized protein n=1 Tax=Palaeococcus pacificus DY20341 TaxID=1343739 RepID=A0A075LT51_9EURY|nr:hypothetical protein PAP_05455 [Palaeococcus pacificus DY20341]